MSQSVPIPAGFFRASQVNSARATTLCAIGALIGLGIAGYGLFTAAGTSTRAVPPESIATVNQRPILRSDFITQLETETGHRFGASSRAEQVQVLGEMLREELLVQRALELDFGETDQTARNALAAAVSDQALAEVTTSEPTLQQLEDYYSQNPGKWATEGVMTLRHFVLREKSGVESSHALADAGHAVDELRSGVPAEEVMRRYGITEEQRQDGEYYFTEKYRLGDTLFAAISSARDGEFTSPVALADGIHFVQMLTNTRPVPLGFATARSQVRADYTDAATARVMDNTIRFLRSRAKVRIADDYAADHIP